jgi:hypothetical protein
MTSPTQKGEREEAEVCPTCGALPVDQVLDIHESCGGVDSRRHVSSGESASHREGQQQRSAGFAPGPHDTPSKGEREEALEVIARLRSLLGKVTPAPWRAMMQGNAPLLDGTLAGQARLEPVPRPYEPRWVGFQNPDTAHKWHHSTVLREEDAEFIAAMRNNAAWLFDTIERLLFSSEAEGEMREALEQIANLEIDISFMADHLIWAKGLARAALSPKEGGK